MISIVRTLAAIMFAAATVTLAGCNAMMPEARRPFWTDCTKIPNGTYSGSGGGKTITMAVSATDPGFKHNVAINVDPPNWNYTATCTGPSTMTVEAIITPGTTATTWTVSDGGNRSIQVHDIGTGGGDPTPGFNGSLTQ